MRERKEREKRAREAADRQRTFRPPNMTRALPPASVYSDYSQRGTVGPTFPWSQPAQYMFYNDDVDEPASPTQYPTFYQTGAMFQRR